MKKQWFFALTSLLLSGVATAAWTVEYPKGGAPVVEWSYRRAAEELKAGLGGTGTVRLGSELASKAGFDTSSLSWYDNVIAERDGVIYLFGKDVARNPNQPYWEWSRAALPTMGAVTRFLHDFAGVRFIAPGQTGTEIPSPPVVPQVKKGLVSCERPSQLFGCGEGSATDVVYGYASGYPGMGLFHTYGGHTHPVAVPLEKYAKTHPEYFGLSKDGRRVLGPDDGLVPRCISNPDVRRLIVEELLRRYDEGAAACQLAQQDGSSHCHCAKCRALYGTGDDWNEKMWLFHLDIAREIERLRPGRIVHILSYDITAHPPKSVRKFPSNVMVELCRYSEEAFAEWDGYEVPQGFTVYTYLWGNYQQPGFVGRHSFAALSLLARRLVRRGVKGIFRCGYGDLFGLEGPGYYVFNGILRDPEARVDGLVAEYCRAAFGPAASLMQRFYETQDERLRMFDKVNEGFPASSGNGTSRYLVARPKYQGDLHAWMYSPDTIRLMDDLLSRAEKTPGISEKARRRLSLVRSEFDYAQAMGKIAVAYAAYRLRPTQPMFDALAEALEERRAAMAKVRDEAGKVRKIDGWPEMSYLGGQDGVSCLETNGRLAAKMNTPLDWDVERMKRNHELPDSAGDVVRWKRENARKGLEKARDWKIYDAKNAKPGLEFKVNADGFGCVFGTGTNDAVQVVAHCGMNGGKGLKPFTKYRASWFVRLEDVRDFRGFVGGFSALIQYGSGKMISVPAPSEGLVGTIPWQRMSAEFETNGKPWSCEFIFRILNTQGRVEIDEATLEEIGQELETPDGR